MYIIAFKAQWPLPPTYFRVCCIWGSLYDIVWYRIALSCNYCIVLQCIVLQRGYCIILYCIVLFWNELSPSIALIRPNGPQALRGRKVNSHNKDDKQKHSFSHGALPRVQRSWAPWTIWKSQKACAKRVLIWYIYIYIYIYTYILHRDKKTLDSSEARSGKRAGEQAGERAGEQAAGNELGNIVENKLFWCFLCWAKSTALDLGGV